MLDSSLFCRGYGCFMSCDTLSNCIRANDEQAYCSGECGWQCGRVVEVGAAHYDTFGRQIG
jgi:hypothetical protein